MIRSLIKKRLLHHTSISRTSKNEDFINDFFQALKQSKPASAATSTTVDQPSEMQKLSKIISESLKPKPTVHLGMPTMTFQENEKYHKSLLEFLGVEKSDHLMPWQTSLSEQQTSLTYTQLLPYIEPYLTQPSKYFSYPYPPLLTALLPKLTPLTLPLGYLLLQQIHQNPSLTAQWLNSDVYHALIHKEWEVYGNLQLVRRRVGEMNRQAMPLGLVRLMIEELIFPHIPKEERIKVFAAE